MIETDDKLVYASDEPNIGELIQEYQRCTPFVNGWNRLEDNDATRFAVWDGQDLESGKKKSSEGKPAFPWEDASDARVFLADRVINENVAMLVMAFWRSVAVARGVESSDASGDGEQAAHITKLLEWLMGTKMKRELAAEVELSAQYREHYGCFIPQITWEREIELDLKQVKFAAIQQVAAQIVAQDPVNGPAHPLAILPALIMEKDTEAQAVEIATGFLNEIVKRSFQSDLGDDADDLLAGYEVKPKRVRQFIRDLREKSSAEIPVPYVCKNQPCVRVRKLWEDIFIHSTTTDIQKSRIFVRDFYHETDLRAAAKVNGWSPAWVEAAVKRKGAQSTWTGTAGDSGLNATTATFTTLEQQQTGHNLIEVITCYQRQLDEDDIPAINYTVFHADIKEDDKTKKPLYAKHDRLNYKHKKLPFAFGCRERWNRSLIASRGVPEIVASRQREVKVQRDGLVDYTSINLIPPINVPCNSLGTNYVIAPARKNVVQPGRAPEFMDTKGRGEPVAFQLMELFKNEIDEEFGFLSEAIPAPRVQMKQQMLVNSYLLTWTEVFNQMFALIQQYMPDADYQTITGSPKPLPKDNMISKQPDFILDFDMRQLDMEHVKQQFEAILSVLQWDRSGTIDTAKLVRVMARAVNPSIAKEIIQEPQGAAMQVQKRVKDDFVAMMAGLPPEPTMDDNPTAGMELQIAQQLLQTNPKIQQAMQSDQVFQELLQGYVKNKEFNLQQQQNRQTGRTGGAA
jgi:hypothetical protein